MDVRAVILPFAFAESVVKQTVAPFLLLGRLGIYQTFSLFAVDDNCHGVLCADERLSVGSFYVSCSVNGDSFWHIANVCGVLSPKSGTVFIHSILHPVDPYGSGFRRREVCSRAEPSTFRKEERSARLEKPRFRVLWSERVLRELV